MSKFFSTIENPKLTTGPSICLNCQRIIPKETFELSHLHYTIHKPTGELLRDRAPLVGDKIRGTLPVFCKCGVEYSVLVFEQGIG